MKQLAILFLLLCTVVSAQVADPPAVPPDFNGQTKVAVIPVNFADAQAAGFAFDQDDIDTLTQQMFGPGLSISGLFDEMSFGVDSFTGDVLAPVTISTNGYDGTLNCGFMSSWKNAAIAQVHQTSPGLLDPGNPSGYELVAVFMSKRSGCDSSLTVNGVALRNDPNDPNPPQLASVVMTNWRTAQTAAHEFGHLKGWHHSDLEGYTGPNQGYGDHSCVMGDNYIYSGHPEYGEYNGGPGNPDILLTMRHASAPNKISAGYIQQADLFDTPDAVGISSVYLAPTQVAPGNFPTPPGGADIWHAAVIDVTGVEDIYVVSYRRSSQSAYDSDPMFDHLMNRVQVHSYPRVGAVDPIRRDNLEAGESFTDGAIKVTAITDGLSDAEYVEVEIEVLPYFAALVDIENPFEEKNLTAFSSAIPITVENPGPQTSAAADFDLTLANADPAIIASTFTPSSVTLSPGMSMSVDLVLQFSGPPADGSYSFDVVVSDATNPRPTTTVSSVYVNDIIGPQLANLTADHQGDRVVVTWDEERTSDTYDVWKNGNLISDDQLFPSVLDLAVTYNQEPDYEVEGTDQFGNIGPRLSVTAIYPCKVAPSISVDRTDIYYGITGEDTVTATVTNHNPAGCPDMNYSVDSTTTPPGSWNILGGNTSVAANGGTGTVDVSVAFFPFPDPNPSETSFAFVLKATDPNGIPSQSSPTISFAYDTTAPSAPSNLDAANSSGDAILSWTAASDALTSIKHYNVYRDSSLIGSSTTTSYTDSGSSGSSPTSYEVRAVDQGNNEGTGDTWSVAIQNIAKDFSVCNQTTVSWTTTNAVSCQMRYRLENSSTWSSWYNTNSGTSHAVTVPTSKNKRYVVELDCIAETTFTMKTPKWCISM